MVVLCVILALTSILNGLDAVLVKSAFVNIPDDNHMCFKKAESMLLTLRRSSILRMLYFLKKLFCFCSKKLKI